MKTMTAHAHRPQLALVDARPGDAGSADAPAERIYAHWVWMMGKRPGLVAFGPGRRRVVERALALYSEGTLCLAIDGCAASRWHAGDNDRGRRYDDLELILRDEAHIERFAEAGLDLRERAAAMHARAQQAQQTDQQADQPADDPAEQAAARERVRLLAQRMRGAARG